MDERSVIVVLTSVMLLLHAIGTVIGALVASSQSRHHPHGWKMVSKLGKSVCSQTRFPERCASSLASYPSYKRETPDDLMSLVIKESMELAKHAHEFAMSLNSNIMNEKENAAWQDCIELFEDTMDHLNVCLSNESDKKYIPNWLSAALTNQDTCLNGFRDLNVTATSNIKDLILSRALNVSELVSNSLSIYKYFSLSANTLKNRRLMSLDRQEDFQSHYGNTEEDGFPEWLSAGDRRLLQSSSPASQANVVVAQDGSGNYRTITQAVSAAPQKSKNRYVIYIKAGIYKENVDLSKAMTNLMFIGDGKDQTIVTGSKNVQDGSTTFKSATFGKNLKLVFSFYCYHFKILIYGIDIYCLMYNPQAMHFLFFYLIQITLLCDSRFWKWIHCERYDVREHCWSSKTPSCGTSSWCRPLSSIPLQCQRVPGHFICLLSASILPGSRYLRYC